LLWWLESVLHWDLLSWIRLLWVVLSRQYPVSPSTLLQNRLLLLNHQEQTFRGLQELPRVQL
jgi:hypothetical protein